MNKKIYITEDDHLYASVLKHKLGHSHNEITMMGDGNELLDQLQTEIPDLIVLDISLPNLNGIDTLKEIRSNEKTKDIPVIMLTNITNKLEHTQATDLGISGYFIKSEIDATEVIDKIKSILQNESKVL